MRPFGKLRTLWPWSRKRKAPPSHALVLRAKFDSAQTTPDNRRHWANADHLAAEGGRRPRAATIKLSSGF